jgi:ankyrin repeat protein
MIFALLVRQQNDGTDLMLAAEKGRTEVVRLLVAAGADSNLQSNVRLKIRLRRL